MARKPRINVKSRLNLKLDQDLKDWVMTYAVKNGTTVSNLIRNYFIQLYEAELDKQDQEIVSQI